MIDARKIAGGFVAAWVLGACASGDTQGFSSGNASFGTGPGGGGTAADDGTEGDDGAEDGPSSASPTGQGEGDDTSVGDDDAFGDDLADSGDTGQLDGQTCVPSDEVCDGEDNDCDGDVDEGEPGAGVACSTGLSGPCGQGVTACEGGAVVCLQVTTPVAETCDGEDNDSNGQIDDGNPDAGSACDSGLPGICASGTTACEGGTLVCDPNQQAVAETCNGVDDDCDGTVDDGNPGGGGACTTGLPGICGPGTLQCTGSLTCVQNQAASAEICGNGIDENCNGTPDDGCACGHDVCATGTALVSGCSPCVTSICAVDAFCCSNSWDSLCVGQVDSVCGLPCQGTCSHSLCVTGGALVSGCVACATEVCAADPFCCNNSWDSLCVGEVGSICGITC